MSEEELELKRGSDDPFRDLGMPEPDANRMKADLAAAIIGVLDRRGLSVRAAGKVVGVPHSAIVNIRNAKLSGFSIERLVRILNALDRRVEVRISRAGRRKAA